MKVKTTQDHAGRDVLSVEGSRGLEHLPADSVFIRASDGTLFISGNGIAGPLRDALTPEELAMVAELTVVKKLKNIRA